MILLDEDRQTLTDAVRESSKTQVREPFLAGWMFGFRAALKLVRRTLDYQSFQPERREQEMHRDLRVFTLLKMAVEEVEPDPQQMNLQPPQEEPAP